MLLYLLLAAGMVGEVAWMLEACKDPHEHRWFFWGTSGAAIVKPGQPVCCWAPLQVTCRCCAFVLSTVLKALCN